MNNKSLRFLIQRRFSKFFLIDEFYPLSSWQNLGGGVKPPGKFFLYKLDVCIAKGEKRHT